MAANRGDRHGQSQPNLCRVHDAFRQPTGSLIWLDSANVDAKIAEALIAPAPEGLLEVYEVSPAVNRVANDSAALLEPASAAAPSALTESSDAKSKPAKAKPIKTKKDDGQASLF